MEKPKLIIIGAGVSGLSAGIYALDNGFDVTIYEKHAIAGGQCTGWDRGGLHIDGCAHWIVGTNSESDLFPLWKHVGAFDENSTIYNTEYFCKFDVGDGRIFTFWADLEALKREMLSFAPEDRRMIRSFIRGIRSYRHVHVPVNKPLDGMNLWELTCFGIKFLPMALNYLRYTKISSGDYAKKFRSPVLRSVFSHIIDGKYNIHSLFYIMQTLSKNDAGVVAGGSRALAERIRNHYLAKGGKLHLSSEVAKINVKGKLVTGITLKKNGAVVPADYVIASADLHHTLYDLLGSKVRDLNFEEKVANRKDNPLITCVLAAFRLSSSEIDGELPKMISFKTIEPVRIASTEFSYITVRNHAFDRTLYRDDVTLTVLLDVKEDTFDALSVMDRDAYRTFKLEIGEHLRREIVRYFGFSDTGLSLLDVATPLTHHRYTNAWKGAYMSFLTTPRSRELMRKGLVKGLDNFFLAGQWLMSPGGLPIALFTGKHAVWRLQKSRKKKFIDLDSQPSSAQTNPDPEAVD